MLVRQFCAACARSFSVISTWTNLEASAKVADETSGPTGGAVPNAGGAPGGNAVGFCGSGSCAAVAVAAPISATDEVIRNSRRDFDMRLRLRWSIVEEGTGK